jgi:hypothetical protein
MATNTTYDGSHIVRGRNQSRKAKNTRKGRRQKDSSTSRSIVIREIVQSKILKYDESNLSSTSSTTVGYVDLIAFALGNTAITRNSDVIRVVKVDFSLLLNAANADVFGATRIAFFCWKQDTASVTPGTFSFFQDVNTYGVVSPEQYANRQKYKKYFDNLLKYVGTASAPTSNSEVKFNFVKKFKGYGHMVMYTAGATTGYNHLYFANVGDSSIAPHPAYQMMVRTWFYDS